MQASAAKLAKNAARIEAFVAFLTQRCLLDEPPARAIATKNTRKWVLDDLAYGHSFLADASDDDVPDTVESFLQLDDLFEGEQLALITSKLTTFFLAVRAATAAGKTSNAVTIVRKLVDVYTGPFRTGKRDLLDSAISLHNVTITGLRDAKSKPDGFMTLFPSGMREYLMRKIPELARIFEHLLAQQDKLHLARNGPELGADFELGVEPAELEPVAAQITAPSRKRVLVATVSGDNEEASGYTTPSPTKISKLSKLELFRLQCAPLKMPRQRQD
jgi:hypothetical protein